MWFGIISLFPEMFKTMQYGITGRAILNQLIQMSVWNPRDFTKDKHRTVDDSPYGGGPGMVMKAEPLQEAINKAKESAPAKPTVIYLSPQGKQFTQAMAKAFAAREALVLVSGRYEGIDERVLFQSIDEEWSIGDYVLSGGELAAMVVIDAITRLIPAVLGHEDSAAEDTFSAGLLKYPQYTRPEQWNGLSVPAILMSGNHQAIARYRLKQSLARTWLKRPDLLTKVSLSKEELALLIEFVTEGIGENEHE